jgi:hypothetical protein
VALANAALHDSRNVTTLLASKFVVHATGTLGGVVVSAADAGVATVMANVAARQTVSNSRGCLIALLLCWTR